MIESVNNIAAENPIEQIWKLLRFFGDIPSVSNTIIEFANDNAVIINPNKCIEYVIQHVNLGGITSN